MTDLHERVAQLEADRDTDRATQEQILKHVAEINAQMNKYKGFFGAVWFAVSCVSIFFSGWKFFHK